MADKTPSPVKKRRWYHNLADAYRITARSYPWFKWVLAAVVVVSIALSIVIAVLSEGSIILWILMGVMTGILLATLLLSYFAPRAMYMQIEGTVGAVYAVLSQIKRGWIVHEQPINATREQDLVWRIVGRPGVVLISEGPSSRVRPLLDAERKKVQRVAQNVPVHVLQVGTGEGQVRLADLQSRLRKFKNVLTREEVPSASQRLNALTSKSAPIPKGIDPNRVRMNRRALRGR